MEGQGAHLCLCLYLISLSFLEEFCASDVFVEIFSWYNLALHIEEERNSNHLPCRSVILIVISQTYVLWFFLDSLYSPPHPHHFQLLSAEKYVSLVCVFFINRAKERQFL